MASIRSPVLVGRESELADIEHALVGATTAGGMLFVVGEAGIGKSRLAQAAAIRAAGLGMRVLTGRAVEVGSRIPFRPLAEAFQVAFRAAGPPMGPEVDELRGVLGSLVPQWSRPRRPPANPILLMEGVVRLLQQLAGRRGALLILEDLHWADSETLLVVDYLASNLPTTHAVCLVTARTDEPLEAARSVGRLAARRLGVVIAPRRLSPDKVAEMASRAFHASATPDVPADAMAAIGERSEGVPLLVEEMLSAYAESRRRGDRADALRDLPGSYEAIVGRRLSLLDADEVAVVEAAAAFGAEIEPALLSAATSLPLDRVRDALRAALRASLLTPDRDAAAPRLVFRHALVAQAVLARLLPDEKRQLFLTAAKAVEREFPGLPGEWCERAAELRMRADDASNAFPLLLEAGRRALTRGALLTAEQTLERARELAAGDPWRTTGADRLLVRVLSLLGKAHRMREIAHGALVFMREKPDLLGTADRTAELQLQVARGLARARAWGEASDQLAVVDGLLPATDGPLHAAARSLEAWIAVETGDVQRALYLSAAALQRGREADIPEVVCEALRTQARALSSSGDLEAARSRLQDARRVAERRDLPLERIDVLLELSRLDEVTNASLVSVEAAARLLRATESPLAEVRVDTQMARLRLARSEQEPAAEALRHAAETCRRFSLPLPPETAIVRAEAAALRGDRAGLRSAIAEPGAGTRPPAGVREALQGALLLLALVKGDRRNTSDAADALALRRSDALGPDEWYGALGRLVALVGGRAGGPTSSSGPNLVAAIREAASAVAAGRAGEREAATARFAAADRVLEPFPWRRQLVRRIVAEAAMTEGWGEPITWLQEAADVFAAASQPELVSACRGLLRRAGVKVARAGRGAAAVPDFLRPLGITGREMDVLALVAEGLSNRDIAKRLYLSVRTVETHVANAIAKAGVESRTALVALVLREGAPSR